MKALVPLLVSSLVLATDALGALPALESAAGPALLAGVPLPPAILLLLTALGALIGFGRFRRH